MKEASSPADHSPYDLLSQPGQSESLIQDIHTTQQSYQEVQSTQESFRGEFLSKEGKDISGEAKLLDFEYQPLKEEMDSYQHDANTPMEADQPPVLDRSPDILQASMDNVPEPEISLDTMCKPEISADKIGGFDSSGFGRPDFLDNPAEPSSPHAAGSPQMPGSPRSVEGFVTSVELNTPDESLGTNFNINQTQDLNGSGMDQPSGPFSVYVSSSPEPQSLEPSIIPPSDLSNVSEVSNGHLEDEGKERESGDFSPVEIVHAQSTVEVVAPPSPGEKLETEMDFVIPEHTPDLMTSSQILSDQPTDITFIPEPAIQPVAEVPVPVYLEGTTPVSEGDDQLSESLSTKEDVSESDKLPESPVAAHEPEIIMKNQENASTMPQEEMEVVRQVNNGLDYQETPAPIQGETMSPIVSEVIDQQEIKKESEAVLNSEVTSNEVTTVISTPEVVASPVLEKKTKVPEAKPSATKSPSKSAKTPLKSSLDKAGKTTPAQDTARKTPVSKTPTRTPLAKSTERKTLVSKTESKPSPTKTTADKPSASRLTSKPTSATKPTTAKPSTTKPATAKPATTKPAAPKPTTAKPAPRTTTSRAATSTLSSTTKPTERKVPKPPTPTAPRASLSKPSSAANKPTAARPTPAARTTPPTKRPGTAPVRTATDKADSGKVNGTSTARLGTRPGTASTTTTTATRKPLTTTTRTTTKPTAEKETKNTTNRILSTTRTAPRSTVGVTKTASKTSTVAGRSTLTESKTTSRVNGTTSTTTTKSRVTTKSVAAKATGEL